MLIAVQGYIEGLVVTQGYGASTPAGPDDFRQSVIYFLNNIAALTAIVGGRIYWADPSERSIYPNVCCKVTKRDYLYNLAGDAGVSTAEVDVVIQSQGLSAESNIVAGSKAIRDNLSGFRGLVNGCPWMWCYLDDEFDDAMAPPDGSARWIYSLTLTYRIRHRVPAPANVTQTNV